MNEEKAVALMLMNLKKAKSSNLLDFAKACRFLKIKWGFKEMSNFFKTSQYMLRQIDKINELDPELQSLVKKGILKIESSYQLWRQPEEKRKEISKIIQNMSSSEIREFINFLNETPKDVSVKDCKKIFDKTKNQKVNLVIIPFPNDLFRLLKKHSQKSGKTIHDFIYQIIEENLNGKK